MFKQSKLVSILAVAGIALFGAQAVQAQVVKIDGSSTVYPITEAVAEEFQKAKKNAIKVTVGISGTGGGFKKFCRGEIDIANASRPILKKEMDACKEAGIEYIELPVAFDALTVVMNPKNAFLKELTVEQLKAIWEPAAQGKITKWNQVNPAWPDAPIKLFGAGADSGTFDYFTEAIVGKAKSSRGDYTASEDDNVLVQGVSRDVNAIGYFGYAYYAENKGKLKAVPIVEGRQAGGAAVRGKRAQGFLPTAVAPDLRLHQSEVPGKGGSPRVRRVLHEERFQADPGSEVRAATGQGLHGQHGTRGKEKEGHRLRRYG